MGNTDTTRIDHDNTDAPTTFRDTELAKILNEIDEENVGEGFSDIVKTGVFTSRIDVYADSGKTLLKTKTTVSRTGPFISQIQKIFYDRETGLTPVATVTAGITRNVDNSIKDVTIVRTRP